MVLFVKQVHLQKEVGAAVRETAVRLSNGIALVFGRREQQMRRWGGDFTSS